MTLGVNSSKFFREYPRSYILVYENIATLIYMVEQLNYMKTMI
jgi:hypothetical protein